MSAVRVEPIAIPACQRHRGAIFGEFGGAGARRSGALEHRLAADRMWFRTATRRQSGNARVEVGGRNISGLEGPLCY